MIINKSSFKTKIGTLYYLWIDDEEGPKVASISTSPGSFEDYIKKINTTKKKKDTNTATINDKKLPVLEKNVLDYIEGGLKDIALEPVFLVGSKFEKKVWNAARRIPYGKTLSYGDISGICGNPNTGRAVGNAMGKNPVLLLVPCHRIIKSNGNCGGFSAGPGLKKKLQELEGININ